jgi:uridine kinase
MTVFVFITGASGSGKTHIAKKLFAQLHESEIDVAFLTMDDYYKPRPDWVKTLKDIEIYNSNTNFDIPDALDFKLFFEHLNQLNEGKTIAKPLYDIATSNRLEKTQSFSTHDVIIIEGIFALHQFEQLSLKESISVFVESDSYLSYQNNRMQRDLKERAHSQESFKKHELSYVRNGFFSYVLPSKTHAQTIIYNNPGNPNKTPLSPQLEKLSTLIEKKLAPTTHSLI